MINPINNTIISLSNFRNDLSMTFTTTIKSKRSIGALFEQAALNYLKRQGLKLLVQNFSCKTGEIDLIMYKDSLIIFIEVRYRKSAAFMDPICSITRNKQMKIIKTAQFYSSYKVPRSMANSNYRFDVLALTGAQNSLEIEWIQGAFRVEY